MTHSPVVRFRAGERHASIISPKHSVPVDTLWLGKNSNWQSDRWRLAGLFDLTYFGKAGERDFSVTLGEQPGEGADSTADTGRSPSARDTLEQMNRFLNASKDSTILFVSRDGRTRYVVIPSKLKLCWRFGRLSQTA
jgi:hypothetical protein